MSGFLTFLTLLDALIIIGLVLMQRSKSGGGLGAVAGGQSEAMFGANASNVLTKLTAWCTGIFFVLVMLSIIASGADAPKSELSATDNQAAVVKTTPVVAEQKAAVAAKVKPVAAKTEAKPAPKKEETK